MHVTGQRREFLGCIPADHRKRVRVSNSVIPSSSILFIKALELGLNPNSYFYSFIYTHPSNWSGGGQGENIPLRVRTQLDYCCLCKLVANELHQKATNSQKVIVAMVLVL